MKQHPQKSDYIPMSFNNSITVSITRDNVSKPRSVRRETVDFNSRTEGENYTNDRAQCVSAKHFARRIERRKYT